MSNNANYDGSGMTPARATIKENVVGRRAGESADMPGQIATNRTFLNKACGHCGSTYTVRETYPTGDEFSCRMCGRTLNEDGSVYELRIGKADEGAVVTAEQVEDGN